jgi:hypothetical protein
MAMDQAEDGSTIDSSMTVDQAASGFLKLAGDSDLFEMEDRSGDKGKQRAAEAADSEDGDRETPAESTEEEESGGEQTEDGAGDQSPTTKVIKDSKGNEYEVPVELAEEFEKGSLRQQDYTVKTQKVSELKKEAETEKVTLKTEREQLATVLTQLRQALEAVVPKEPDWDRIARDKPEEFSTTWAAWQVQKERLSKVKAAEQEANEQVLVGRKADMDALLAQEQASLVAAFPDIADPIKVTAIRQRWVKAAESHGFNAEDLNLVRDHRLFILLDKASKYDALKAGTKKGAPPTVKVAGRPTITMKPGSTLSAKAVVSEATRAKQRLAKTGSAEDAAAAFLAGGFLD